MTLRRTLLAVLSAAAVVTPVAVAGPALAGNVYRIKASVPSPTDPEHKPIPAGGSWLINKPSGYYLGQALGGTRFDVVGSTRANYHYGRAIDGVNMCAWIVPGAAGTKVTTRTSDCSAATREKLTHRLLFGKDYNADAHAADTGSSAPTTGCQLSYNYFHGTTFTGGTLSKPVGAVGAKVLYRFTTRDGKAAVVRDPRLGWGFVPRACVKPAYKLWNTND
ncbi:MAG: hypothetical protein JWM64_786 [Frankiales bacterium]|nr:hypothetical protein [Frankiales bacterium]